ncbi:MAG: hypothetical protein ACYSR0_06305 [Planctomycetota bacterium]
MNAFRSWSILEPQCEVIVFGNGDGTKEAVAELNFKHVPGIVRNEYGTPLLNDLFETAEQIAKHDILCYVNSDIILTSDILVAINRIRSRFHTFLLSGRRMNLDLGKSLNFSRCGWESDLREYAYRKGKIEPPWGGIDYFVYPKGTWETFPPFAIGRARWDSWFLYKACSNDIPLVDATNVVMAIHQNHDYSHHPQGRMGIWKGPEARKNFELLGGYEYIFTILNATHRLRQDDLKRNLTFNPVYLARWFATLPALYSSLKPLAKLIKHFVILWFLLKRTERVFSTLLYYLRGGRGKL